LTRPTLIPTPGGRVQSIVPAVLVGVRPARGKCFIRRIETEETYRGGSIFITAKSREKVATCQFVVVSVGDYEACHDLDECNRPHHKGFMHKHRLKVGDWVVVRNRTWLATPDPDVFVCRQADVLGKFEELST
jgi:co-chaperonin GroES (HSP10)